MDTGIGVNQDTFGGETLGAVAGDRVAMVEMQVLLGTNSIWRLSSSRLRFGFRINVPAGRGKPVGQN
jgi:hypothetical protein